MSTVNVSKDFHLYLCIESILHIHPDFDDAIKGILARDPKAHIFLAASSGRSNWKAKLLRRLSIKIGKQNAQTRIHFLMDVDQKQELTLLQTADSVLGSIHMTRPRAAIQAFTAGVPVVTWPGELWSSRITYGFYRQMRVHELIATSLEEYIDLAVRLATESEFRNTNSKRIQTMRRHIFGDTKAILEWEKFFDFSSKNQKQNSKKKKQQQQKAKKNSIKNKTKQQQQKINQDSIKTIGLIDDDEFKLKD
jgi:predicted O-linked N-acetylglucosamine transferase (SPINDLY family)